MPSLAFRGRPVRALAAAMGFCAVALPAWGAFAYFDLLRCEVDLTDAWARVGAASRAREELVDNFLRLASLQSSWAMAPPEVASLRAAQAATADEVPDAVRDSSADGTYNARQAELTRLLAGIETSPLAALPAWRLYQPRLDASRRVLEQALARLADRRSASDAVARRFPGSWIAPLASSAPTH